MRRCLPIYLMLTLIAAQGSGLIRGVHLLVDHCPECEHGAHHAECHGCDHECGSAATQPCSAAQQANLAYTLRQPEPGARNIRIALAVPPVPLAVG